MRRAAPKSSVSFSSIDSKDKERSPPLQQQQQQQHRRRTAINTSVVTKWIFLLMVLFVVADVMYLYKLSSNAFGGRPSDHKMYLSQRSQTRQIVVAPVNHLNITNNAIPTVDKMMMMTTTKKKETVVDKNDKGPILAILEQAGIDTHNDLDSETIDALPTWFQIQQMIGTQPIIYGLETCQSFRDSIDPTVRFFGIAGTFNTGTNLLSELMIQNCQITERMEVYGNKSKGIRWQVPWGKHYPAFRRGGHVTTSDKDVPQENSLPLVTIRDPYQWMQSMCRHDYAAHWPHTKANCPNIVNENPHQDERATDDFEQEDGGTGDVTPLVPVEVKYAPDFITHHDSLPHFWNDWYRLYVNATFPRIIVRFEDLLFYGKEVTETLCACGGGVTRADRKFDHFVYVSKSAKLGTKAHGKDKTDLVAALIKYGSDAHRFDNLTPEDLKAAEQILDPHILQTFRYSNSDEV